LYVPQKNSQNNNSRNPLKRKAHRKAYPRKLKNLFIRKAILWRKYKSRKTKKRKNAYSNIANKCKNLLAKFESDAENEILRSCDLGKFYKYVNSKLSSKSGVGPLKNEIGEYIFTPEEKGKILNDYFSSVCTVDDGLNPSIPGLVSPKSIEVVTFSQGDTFAILKKLKSSLSAGPDGYPPLFFKNLAGCLAKPLTMLNRTIFSFEELPLAWRAALVTPVFKKGCSSNVSNYRPISLTCVACKIFETTVKNCMLKFLMENDLISRAQHGFIAGHSTNTNLLESLNDWTINLKNGHQTRIAYVDFTKAFDTVCHNKLLVKLAQYGIAGPLRKIIKSFLTNRTQQVVVDGVKSHSAYITSGVPQGSVLGPLLFVIYINDLADIFPEGVISKLFADDAKLYTEIRTSDDIDNLQFSIDKLSAWAETWQLEISISKCSAVDISLRNKEESFCDNIIEGVELITVKEVTDLGVKFDSKLTFTPHVSQIVAKAKQRLFLLFRAFHTRESAPLLIAYKSYILPIISYCSSVWSPSQLGDVYAIESVQRLFTRRLLGLEKLSYDARLKVLQIPSLELRRLRADLLMCFKIVNGYIAGPPENYGLHTVVNRSTRGHDKKLFCDHTRVEPRRNYFGNRIIGPWNSLSAEIVNAPSIAVFKRLLLSWNFSKFLQLNFDNFEDSLIGF
jgi:hypothetical protein